MSYFNHDGNPAAIAEPNGPVMTEATPAIRKSKPAEKENKPDEIDDLLQMMERKMQQKPVYYLFR
jgi:hypothetical protein